MRIDAVNQVSQIYQASKPRKVNNANTAYAKDEFQISCTAQDYGIAKKAVSEAQEVREDKVAYFKNALASGTYNVSSQEIADKLVGNYLDSIF